MDPVIDFDEDGRRDDQLFFRVLYELAAAPVVGVVPVEGGI